MGTENKSKIITRKSKNFVRKFLPGIGNEKEFDGLEIIEANTRNLDSKAKLEIERTRSYIVKVLSICIAIAIVASAGYSVYTGSVIPIISVWAVTGPFIGAMVAYYFERKG